VVPICVIRFWQLQVWRYLIQSQLILLQRTPESFVIVRIVEVVAVRAGGLGTLDFARLVAAPEIIMCLLFTISTLFFCFCGGGGSWGCLG
jgi:hypothetical protein